MKINRATDYAIRLLIHLAEVKEESTADKLAKELDISFNHIAKIIPNLAKGGFILTRKGKGGGVTLAREPKKINLAEIIEVIEGPLVISDCIFHRETCRLSQKCMIRKKLGEVRSKMLELFGGTSILDLVPSK